MNYTRPDLVFGEILGKKVFSGRTAKDAYLKGCRWYAENIMNTGLTGVSVEYIKNQDGTVTAVLYSTLDENSLKENHCKVCKEAHSLFYRNDDTSCSSCVLEAYYKRAREKLRIRLEYQREKAGL